VKPFDELLAQPAPLTQLPAMIGFICLDTAIPIEGDLAMRRLAIAIAVVGKQVRRAAAQSPTHSIRSAPSMAMQDNAFPAFCYG
jgi:hypothetical protein